MNTSRRYAAVGLRWAVTSLVVGLLSLGTAGGVAYAGIGRGIPCPGDPGCIGPIETELLSLDIMGSGNLPLGAGFADVLSKVRIVESLTAASTGQAFLFDPNLPVQHGDPLFVDSFFDVFFDVTIMDIDPVNDYATGLPSTIMLPGLGPAHMALGGPESQSRPCLADIFQSNYGCLPPVGDIYIGHFNITIPTGVNIGGDLNPDVVRFTVATHSVGNVTNTFISGAEVVHTFDTTFNLSGAVNPPFGPLMLSGPTTASQHIVVAAVPEPATFVLFGAGLGLLGLSRLRQRRAQTK